IYAKHAQQDMRGNNVDGSRYFQPHVRWINYFYKDYAIHGNYWRPLSYFGNINSSHGCVSLVDGEAEWIYAWASIGTPVIVHT
ncbi:MAG: L,D-transpeptidase, partial [Patescibacteria group bacterium]